MQSYGEMTTTHFCHGDQLPFNPASRFLASSTGEAGVGVFTFCSSAGILMAKEERGMDKRALWSRILGIVALMLIVVGFVLISSVGRRLEFGFLVLLGIILAAAGAFLSRSSGRKLVLWGAGVYVATWVPPIAGVVMSALKGGEPPAEPPALISITVLAGFLSLLAIVGGTIKILLGKQPTAPPTPGS
jgi:ABC-type iron transport system FetAB permease component